MVLGGLGIKEDSGIHVSHSLIYSTKKMEPFGLLSWLTCNTIEEKVNFRYHK